MLTHSLEQLFVNSICIAIVCLFLVVTFVHLVILVLQTFCLAGLCAGITEAILVNPFEVVKVTLQVNRAHRTQAPSTIAVTKEIIRTQVSLILSLSLFSMNSELLLPCGMNHIIYIFRGWV